MFEAKGGWPPRSFEFLSGLPRNAAEGRLLVIIQAFADESGGRGHTSHFSMCAVISTADKWAAFSNEWRDCLKKDPWLPYFKMKEAARCVGKFHKFTETQRDKRLSDFADIINKYVSLYTHAVIDLEAHSRTWGQYLDKPRNEPYFWPFHNTINAICFTLYDLGIRERFEMIFDEEVIFGPRAKQWYPVLRAVMKHREPNVYDFMPVDPLFRDDKEFLPLQAADMFEWLTRHTVTNPEDETFNWLYNRLKNVAGTIYSQTYDEARLRSVLQQASEIAKSGEVPDIVQSEYDKLF